MSEKLWGFWEACHRGSLDELRAFDIHQIKDEWLRTMKDATFPERFREAFTTYPGDQIPRACERVTHDAPGVSPERIEALIHYLNAPEFVTNMGRNHGEQAANCLPGLTPQSTGTIAFNLVIRDSNYIRVDNDGIIFYIVQYNQQIALVFPIARCIIDISHAPQWVLWGARNTLDLLFAELVANADLLKSANLAAFRFSGYLIGNIRPYHYFYDQLYGLEWLVSKGLVPPSVRIYQTRANDYCEVSAAYGFEQADVHDEYTAINRALLSAGEYVLSPSMRFSSLRNEHVLRQLDLRLRKHSIHGFQKGLPLSRTAAPLIWVGVCSEKRSWVEAQDGLAQILCRIYDTHPGCGIILDGWTSAISPSGDSTQKLKKDMAFAKKLISSLPPKVHIINLIGSRAMEKIYWAQKADFFIAHYATDTMYVSRICQIPGVTFGSTSTGPALENHVHHDLYAVPQEFVADLPSSGTAAYSIPWQKVHEQVMLLWEERLSVRYAPPTMGPDRDMNWRIRGYKFRHFLEKLLHGLRNS